MRLRTSPQSNPPLAVPARRDQRCFNEAADFAAEQRRTRRWTMCAISRFNEAADFAAEQPVWPSRPHPMLVALQ